MTKLETAAVRPPSLDAVLRAPAAALVARFRRVATTEALRETLAAHRAARRFGVGVAALLDGAADALAGRFAASQVPVFNLTGTILHTNLGRAPLPPRPPHCPARRRWSSTAPPGGEASATTTSARCWR